MQFVGLAAWEKRIYTFLFAVFFVNSVVAYAIQIDLKRGSPADEIRLLLGVLPP